MTALLALAGLTVFNLGVVFGMWLRNVLGEHEPNGGTDSAVAIGLRDCGNEDNK